MTMSTTEIGASAAKVLPTRWRPSRETAVGFVSVLAFIGLWHIASLVGPTYAFPSWERIVGALGEVKLADVTITMLRLAVSMAFSFVAGLALATLLYSNNLIEAFFIPLVRLVMAVPAVCWVVFAILWFKDVEGRIFFVMCIVCAPVFLIDSLDAMKNVPADLKQMVESFRPSPVQTFAKVIFPSIVPNILTSWKINLTLAIRIVTIAELVGAVSGIGHGLVVAQEMFSVAVVFAWTVVLVLILFVLQIMVSLIERRALAWRIA